MNIKLPSLEILLPTEKDSMSREERHRFTQFFDWAKEYGMGMHNLNLVTYDRYIQHNLKLAPTTRKAHLSTIRGRFKALLRDGSLKRAIEECFSDDVDPKEKELFVGALLNSIRQAIDPKLTHVVVNPAVRRNLELSALKINDLFSRLSTESRLELRNTAIITLMLCTGIRENELCALDVKDLLTKHPTSKELALHVRSRRSRTERHIPYGEMNWVLGILNTWLAEAGITEGAVFRGFYKGGYILRDSRLSPRTVERIVAKYPIVIDGEPIALKPFDLRQFNARYLFRRGQSVETITHRLGLSQTQTTLNYIGGLYSDSLQESHELDPVRLKGFSNIKLDWLQDGIS